MSLVSEQEVVPSFSGAVSIFESAHAFWEHSDIDLENKLRNFGTPSWNLLSGLLQQNSIPSNKKHKLQLQKTQDEIST